MLDGLSLDQLRVMVAAAEGGSFSAAGRKLQRAPSVISQSISNLETQVGFLLFNRSGRYPTLTEAGSTLLGNARAIIADVDRLKARARGIAGGLEPEVAAVFDAFFPLATIMGAARSFRSAYPSSGLRLSVQAIGGAISPVLSRQCSVGVAGPLFATHGALASEPLTTIEMVTVAAPHHPLARKTGRVNQVDLAGHVQLVLTDQSDLSAGRNYGVVSSEIWRLTELPVKRAMLLDGLGWGGMPLHAVRDDLASGDLVKLEIEHYQLRPLPMHAIWRSDAPPGPAGCGLIEQIKIALKVQDLGRAPRPTFPTAMPSSSARGLVRAHP